MNNPGPLYMILENGIFRATGLEEYGAWYSRYGVFYRCPNVDLGYCNNVFGGYCGRINGLINWKPFYLTYSCLNENMEVFSKTQYFHSFAELSEHYRYYLELDWREFDQTLAPGPFEAEVELWQLY